MGKKVSMLFLLSVMSLSAGTLKVQVSGFRSWKGQLRVSLFNSDKGFPTEHKKAYKTFSTGITDSVITCTFTGLDRGNYAVAVLHDENGNGKMDATLFKRPLEGYGTSNNVKGRFGPPKFKDASFSFTKPGATVSIKLLY